MLEIRVLGELEVLDGGSRVALPPSKKTRALLAYLALTQREHRRDQLCSMFWDVADDPRGALRWSLSKLRALGPSLETNRERVAIATKDVVVDAISLRRLLASKPAANIDLEDLETAARSFRGEPLEGLDLPDFDDYQAWCIAERERARGQRVVILGELVRRLEAQPERAIEHAQSLVRLDPMNEPARAKLVRFLVAVGRPEEARQHHESGKRLAKEGGRAPSLELEVALRPLAEAPQGIVAAPTTSGRRRTPLLGREREVESLDGASSCARSQRSAVVRLVVGEAGIGKSRLLEEWMGRARAQGASVLHGASFEAERGHPYAPWRDALAAAEHDPFVPSVAADATRDQLFAAVADAIAGRVSSGQLLVVVFDDVQWMDEGSAELLHWFARKTESRPLLIVLAARAGELADNVGLLRVIRAFRREGVVEELALAPLSKDAIRSLLDALGSEADPARVHAQSGGNVLFATELARAASSDDVPATLASLVRDRIAQLPPLAADVLRWLAVLGHATDVTTLHEVSGVPLDGIVEAFEQLEARAMLTNGSFAHDVVKRTVYAGISGPRRRLMHQRVARLLASRVPAGAADIADLAHHATLAHDSALAAESCLAAARRSLRLFANADAWNLARRGARFAAELAEPVRTCTLVELAEVQYAARRPPDKAAATAAMLSLAEHATDVGAMSHARRAFHVAAYASWESGGFTEAERHMRDAERVSQGVDEAERVQAMAEAARCLTMLERDLDHAHALALEAAVRGRHRAIENPATFDALGLLALHRGLFDEARQRFEEAHALARIARNHHDEFSALEHLVMVELDVGDLPAARTRARELATFGERFREGSEAPFARALVALTDRADDALDRALVELTEADAQHRLVYVLTRSAELDARETRWDTVRARASRALGIAELLGRSSELLLSRVLLARAARAMGDVDEEIRQRRAMASLVLTTVAAKVRRNLEELDGAS